MRVTIRRGGSGWAEGRGGGELRRFIRAEFYDTTCHCCLLIRDASDRHATPAPTLLSRRRACETDQRTRAVAQPLFLSIKNGALVQCARAPGRKRSLGSTRTYLKNTVKTPSECSRARITLPLSATDRPGSAARRASAATSPLSHRATTRSIAEVSSRDTMLLPPPPPVTLPGMPPALGMPTPLPPNRGDAFVSSAASCGEAAAVGLSSLGSYHDRNIRASEPERREEQITREI